VKRFSLYIFSGLGTDERVFRNIHFPDFVDVHFVPWKKPLPKETLEEYIDRTLKEFDLTKPIVLIGLSFGGVVAQEISRKINPLGTIIISSISVSSELRGLFRLYGNLRLNRITPFRLLQRFHFGANWIFGAYNKEDKKLIDEVIRIGNIPLVKWSVEQILSWRREKQIANLFHLHGDNDKMLPLKNKNVNAIIKGGGHLMIYNRAEEVEIILRKQLERILEEL
jgi:pimeloyl-ACP methyl ester carboxylesterase